MPPIRVFVPLDGSELAESALKYVSVLKALGPLHVRLVGVAEDFHEYNIPDSESLQDREVNLLTHYLEDKKRELENEGLEVEVGVRRGEPARSLLRDQEQYKPDYVVLATHGRSGIRRFRTGSVADKLIRASAASGLTVGPLTATRWASKPLTSIMTPLDGSELAGRALLVAVQLAQATDAELHLVQAVDRPFVFGEITGLAHAEDYAKLYLEDMAAGIGEAGVRVTTAVLKGSPADALRDYVRKHDIGLVVLTSHGRGGVLRAALGSVADRMVGSDAPVLMLRQHPHNGHG